MILFVLHIQHYLVVVYATVSQGVERVKWVWRAYTSYHRGPGQDDRKDIVTAVRASIEKERERDRPTWTKNRIHRIVSTLVNTVNLAM